MVQQVWAGVGAEAELVVLPAHDAEAIPGVRWGTPDVPHTPAYWAVRCRWNSEEIPNFACRESSLIEEIGFCLLGGFGIRYEVNAAAFARLHTCGVFDLRQPYTELEIRQLLLEPLNVGRQRLRYRFPAQRARRLAKMRSRFEQEEFGVLEPLALREKLMEFDGIGPKTASWIVRNHSASDEVAIIDIHVTRACRAMNVFPEFFRLPKDYPELERRFLQFADAIDVRPSVLDAVMWTEIRGGLNA